MLNSTNHPIGAPFTCRPVITILFKIGIEIGRRKLNPKNRNEPTKPPVKIFFANIKRSSFSADKLFG